MPAVQSPLSTTILTPDDHGWDDARKAWDLAVDQRPAAVALPESPADVVAAVRYARERNLRVAAQGTGHNAAPLGTLDGTLLVKTSRMRRLTIDPVARTARAEAGVTWLQVAEAAAEHGLAGLAGSSPDVGVVGYTLGGGMSWLGRSYGLAANNVQAIELVRADGRLVRADACHETELFWALRGGGGSFGVVTAIELRLFPVTEVYAGLLWWPVDAASEVLQAWRELTQGDLPDEFTTSARLMNFPPVPEVPEQIRGRSFVVVDVIHLGTPAEADALLAPLRALRPATDTIGMIPTPALCHLHMDPEQPSLGAGDGSLLAALPAEAVDAIVRIAGPGTELAAGGGGTAPARRRDEPRPAPERRRGRVRRGVRPVRRGSGANPASRLGRRVRRRGPPLGHEPVDGAADVPQPRRDPQGPGQLLDPAGLRPAPPRQGRGRPGRHHPGQPPDPASQPTADLIH